ncbi:MAG TPA: hypothetical protein VEF04_06290, partial [Blastocatellia bacterium]|nr:hypothetical protein [Blastocatellia bacterium]
AIAAFAAFAVFVWGKKKLPKALAKAKYVAFLSHYKVESGAEARIIKDNLEKALRSRYRGGKLTVFLDSDDLFDLSAL